MDNRNDIERNRQLRRIADALEKIAKNIQKPIDNFTMTPNGTTFQYKNGTAFQYKQEEK